MPPPWRVTGLLVGMARSSRVCPVSWILASSERHVTNLGAINFELTLVYTFTTQEMHTEADRRRRTNYSVWMDLSNRQQTVWQVKFECRCGYTLNFPKLRQKDDQWVFPQKACMLKAMWFRATKFREVWNGSWINSWNPEPEASPITCANKLADEEHLAASATSKGSGK